VGAIISPHSQRLAGILQQNGIKALLKCTGIRNWSPWFPSVQRNL